MLRIFRWFVYDSDCIPNRHDSSFKLWSGYGLTTLISLTQRNTVCSFETLQNKHGLTRNEFYRYLQLHSYIDHECKLTGFSDTESEFYHILKNARTVVPSKFISKLYTALSNANRNSTLHIKDKWEKESGLQVSEEAWSNIWSFQSTTSSSMVWEHCWKNIIRYFKTPHQERYKWVSMQCWRLCGSTTANHYHISLDCP